jgi:hypothetical protein
LEINLISNTFHVPITCDILYYSDRRIIICYHTRNTSKKKRQGGKTKMETIRKRQSWEASWEDDPNSAEYKNHLQVKKWIEEGRCTLCGGNLARKQWESPHGGKSERLDCVDCPATTFTSDYMKMRKIFMGEKNVWIGQG